MRRWPCIFLLLACTGALAVPGAPAEDDIGNFMAERGLLTTLEQVSHTVTDRASDLVVTAMGFLGVPYRRGGNSAETGFDCSGCVGAMYERTIGLLLPR